MLAIGERDDALGRVEGAALWPSRFPLDVLERIRNAIGSQAWLSEYMHRPAPEEGAVFKRGWFLSYPTCERPEVAQVIMSMDTAYKVTESADFSVIQIWGQLKNGWALLDQWRERKEFGDLMRKAVAMGEAYSCA